MRYGNVYPRDDRDEEKRKKNIKGSTQDYFVNTAGQQNARGFRGAQAQQSGYTDSRAQSAGRGDNSFYTKQPEYGIIPAEQNKPKYLHEYRNEIKGYDDKLAKLHDEQYAVMVYEQDGKKLDRLAQTQAQLERAKAALEDKYYSAMGIGSEGKSGSENMLVGEGNNPNFSYGNLLNNFDPKDKPSGYNDLVMRYPKGQSPFDEGFFDGKGIVAQPNFIDPNKKPEDMRQYLAAATNPFEEVKGTASAGIGASVTDDKTAEYPQEPNPSPMPAPPPVPEGHPDMDAYEKELADWQKEHDDWEKDVERIDAEKAEENLTKYEEEKKQRAEALQYTSSKEFRSILIDNLIAAKNSLEMARKSGNENEIAKIEEEIKLYNTIGEMNINVNTNNGVRYDDMKKGMQAVQSLAERYQEDIKNAKNDKEYEEAIGKFNLIKDEILAINRGMNVVGEAYLDELDKDKDLSAKDLKAAYREYYQSVIERESRIEVESTSLKENNLTMANASTSQELSLMGILEGLDIPLYSTEEDAVLAFKKEAMPLTLASEKEHGAVLDAIEILDTDTGEVKTFYYYIDVKQGAEDNVVGQAILGAGGGENRKLLHTHPVDGSWNRNFSGDPENHGLFGEMGDSLVPDWLGYGGIYVVGSGAEVKLYEGHGETDIGSGSNTYGNTKDELSKVSIIDLY